MPNQIHPAEDMRQLNCIDDGRHVKIAVDPRVEKIEALARRHGIRVLRCPDVNEVTLLIPEKWEFPIK